MRTVLLVLIVGAWLLLPLGGARLIAAAPRDRIVPSLIWVSFVPAYAVSVAVFFVSERYRLPLLVPLCAGAGAFVDWGLGLFRLKAEATGDREEGTEEGTRGFRLQAEETTTVVVAAVLFGIANWPSGLDDGRAEE